MPHTRNVGGVRPQPFFVCANHFLYGPAVSNVVTNGNGMGTKNVLKGTVCFALGLVDLWLTLFT